MTKPTGMPKGRPVTVLTQLEEARVQAFSLEGELRRHDAWETAALQTLEDVLAPGPARRIAERLIERDRLENRRENEGLLVLIFCLVSLLVPMCWLVSQ